MDKILIIILLLGACVIWFGISALVVFLASLAFGFKMSIFKVLFVFIAGFVINGCLPSKE